MIKLSGKIKPGTICVQSHVVFVWPYAPCVKNVDADTVFEVEVQTNGSARCIARGFGVMCPMADYGYGAVYVNSGLEQINTS